MSLINNYVTYTARPESEFKNRYAGYWRTSIPKNGMIVWKNDYKSVLTDPEAIKTVKGYFDYHTRASKCVLLKWIQNGKEFIPYSKDTEDDLYESAGITYDSIDNVPDPDKPAGMSDTDYKTMITRAEENPRYIIIYKGIKIVATGSYYNPKRKTYKIVNSVTADGDYNYVKYIDDPNKDIRFYSLPDVKKYINNFMLKNEITESLEDEVKANSEKINDFIEDLYDLRKESIAKDGEYGLGNLVFKEFRNLGYLDNLKDLKNKEKSRELSLED